MRRLYIIVIFAAVLTFSAAVAVSETFPPQSVTMEGTVITGLRTAQGKELLLQQDASDPCIGLHVVGDEISLEAASVRRVTTTTVEHDSECATPEEAALTTRITPVNDEFLLQQSAQYPPKNLFGAEWSIRGIPLAMNILFPGQSGLRFTADLPGKTHQFDYPMTWEVQLIIVEGAGEGFYVWAEDPDCTFKLIIIEKTKTCWNLRFISMAYAPFAECDSLTSPPWRIGSYTGDWRVPAKRYRDWMERTFQPTRVQEQEPAWIRDIRCCVIMGMDLDALPELAQVLDPMQTLLYVYPWRAQGYDRDYPAYDQHYPTVQPFIDRAQALGFRIMLHVNYFGVDPLNPLYEQFEPFQVRDPFGKQEKKWWLWERADPVIKFAYINPAHAAWRSLFVERMKSLCESTGVDALHLDQTLCVFNDNNGRIDGITMAQGNIALHREMREALPHIALSGEGLNEITYRYEAFAQRHVRGLNHVDAKWDRSWLAASHPICSYLFTPYVTHYGYLGYAPLTQEQFYAAYNEAYEHWGIIPTLKYTKGCLSPINGFARQFVDEVTFWQEQRLDPAVDAFWSSHVAFPFVNAQGNPVYRTMDHRLMIDNKVISRTITDTTKAPLPGTIPGWTTYNTKKLFGLDPEVWYPYFGEARDYNQPHVSAITEGYRPVFAHFSEELGVITTAQDSDSTINARDLMTDPKLGVRLFGDKEAESGALYGASFEARGADIHAHPPWVGATGSVYAQIPLQLAEIGGTFFCAEVGIDPHVAAKSDGVIFSVTVKSGEQERHMETVVKGEKSIPLELELTPLEGTPVLLELAVHPGEAKNVSFDWARWYNARLEHRNAAHGSIQVDACPVFYTDASEGDWTQLTEDNVSIINITLPGTLFLLRSTPEEITLPLDLAQQPFVPLYVDYTGKVLDTPSFGGPRAVTGRFQGKERNALFAHPPYRGTLSLHYPMTLPDTPAVFTADLALRDGAKDSNGVLYSVAVNGQELAREEILIGDCRSLTCDLSPWRNQSIVLTLTTDALDSANYDWAHWIEPRLVEKD